MPNDSQNPFAEAAEAAARETDEELAGEEAKLTTPSWDELKKKLPSPVDQKNLDQLIQIVNDATDHNEKVAALIQNVSALGGTIVKVLSTIR
jgi:proline dehydrogenase